MVPYLSSFAQQAAEAMMEREALDAKYGLCPCGCGLLFSKARDEIAHVTGAPLDRVTAMLRDGWVPIHAPHSRVEVM